MKTLQAQWHSSVIPRREVQANLMEFELNSDRGIGITAWLVSGLKLQELQLSLLEI
jgi:hypothetical protein